MKNPYYAPEKFQDTLTIEEISMSLTGEPRPSPGTVHTFVSDREAMLTFPLLLNFTGSSGSLIENMSNSYQFDSPRPAKCWVQPNGNYLYKVEKGTHITDFDPVQIPRMVIILEDEFCIVYDGAIVLFGDTTGALKTMRMD